MNLMLLVKMPTEFCCSDGFVKLKNFFTPRNIESVAISILKNDSRPCMGASAFLKSVDFRAFAVNVKTIAPIQRLYQSGHVIWCERSAGERIAYSIFRKL